MPLNHEELAPQVLLKWLLSFALPAAVYFCLATFVTTPDFTSDMNLFVAVTLWAVCLWAMSLLNDTAVALALPIVYILICEVPQKVIFAPWLGDVPITIIGGFSLGMIMSSTGLGKRIALSCVKTMGGGLVGAIVGISIGAAIVSPLIPSLMGKAAIFLAIAIALCDTLDYKPRSREATTVVLATCVAIGATKLCYLTGGGDLVMGMALVDETLGTHTMWLEYAFYNFLPGMLYLVMSLALLLIMVRVHAPKELIHKIVVENYEKMGPMTAEQRRALCLILATVLLLATDRFHGISSGHVLICVTVVSFLPGIHLMNEKKLAAIDFAPLFFIMGCTSIGYAGHYLKVTDMLAELVLPLMNGLGETMTGVAGYAVGALLNFLLTPTAATSAFSSPLAQLGIALNVEPRVLYFAFQYGLDNLIFPYEYALYLYFYSSGYISFRIMAFVLGVRMLVTPIFLALVAIPWWHLVIS